jgi:hypothetical protein
MKRTYQQNAWFYCSLCAKAFSKNQAEYLSHPCFQSPSSTVYVFIFLKFIKKIKKISKDKSKELVGGGLSNKITDY